MTTLSSAAVAALARSAGLTGASLVTAVAVAHGESGFRTDARGDVALINNKWGPSIGLWQIRSINAERGTGRTRDELANLDPAHNARAMAEISGGGGNFGAWTIYTTGAYKAHMADAKAAVESLGVALPNLDLGTIPPLAGIDPESKPGGGIPGAGVLDNAVAGAGMVTDAAGNVIGSVVGGVTSVGAFLGHLSDPNFWWRVGKGALGVGLIVGAVVLLKPDLVADLGQAAALAAV